MCNLRGLFPTWAALHFPVVLMMTYDEQYGEHVSIFEPATARRLPDTFGERRTCEGRREGDSQRVEQQHNGYSEERLPVHYCTTAGTAFMRHNSSLPVLNRQIVGGQVVETSVGLNRFLRLGCQISLQIFLMEDKSVCITRNLYTRKD